MMNYFGSINNKFISLVNLKNKKVPRASSETQFKKIAYDKILERQEYLNKYPHIYHNEVISCRVCSSQDIKDWGLLSRDDDKRVHSCNSCGQILWRSRVSI
ncbi:hypothetical protein N7931_03125 [Catenovulum sp. 2E275]|uniref:hypothetical protein n=1 Tax=Catenovulum sp. 2E275 TaxID=2980497 RepID=UPI0021CE7281|nr:hypothetical protein [Catenovulum sp. 2E275]MCU4674616.1 hypothetical protein [Catenovulum sp. 2E275]